MSRETHLITRGERRVSYVQENVASSKAHEVSLASEDGETLMMRRVLIKEPIKEEPTQRRSLFKIKCKIMGKVCKVVIDFGSTNNIILEEAVGKIKLERIPHTHPYRVTWLNRE